MDFFKNRIISFAHNCPLDKIIIAIIDFFQNRIISFVYNCPLDKIIIIISFSRKLICTAFQQNGRRLRTESHNLLFTN